MGDRANVKVHQQAGDVHLYTHWGGYRVGDALALGLDRGRDRWDDPEYLTRILFDAMKGDDVTGTTGYGISPVPTDGAEWAVDVETQTVTGPTGSWTFEQMADRNAAR